MVYGVREAGTRAILEFLRIHFGFEYFPYILLRRIFKLMLARSQRSANPRWLPGIDLKSSIKWPQVSLESNFYRTKNIHDKPSIDAAKREIHFFDRNENYYKNYVRGNQTEPNYEWYRSQMPYTTKNQVLIVL